MIVDSAKNALDSAKFELDSALDSARGGDFADFTICVLDSAENVLDSAESAKMAKFFH